jgi:hypothetical protein
MMSTRDRRDAIVEVEAQLREEDINHHPRINTKEKIDSQKEIGINKIILLITTIFTRIQSIIQIKLNNQSTILWLLLLMREEKIILNLKLRPSSKITKA